MGILHWRTRDDGRGLELVHAQQYSTSANPVEYAQCVKMLGNGRLEAKCQDGETRLGQIRGQMRKKVCQARPLGRLIGR